MVVLGTDAALVGEERAVLAGIGSNLALVWDLMRVAGTDATGEGPERLFRHARA